MGYFPTDFRQKKHEKSSKYLQTGNCMCPIAAEGRVSDFIFLVEAGGGGEFTVLQSQCKAQALLSLWFLRSTDK